MKAILRFGIEGVIFGNLPEKYIHSIFITFKDKKAVHKSIIWKLFTKTYLVLPKQLRCEYYSFSF